MREKATLKGLLSFFFPSVQREAFSSSARPQKAFSRDQVDKCLQIQQISRPSHAPEAAKVFPFGLSGMEEKRRGGWKRWRN